MISLATRNSHDRSHHTYPRHDARTPRERRRDRIARLGTGGRSHLGGENAHECRRADRRAADSRRGRTRRSFRTLVSCRRLFSRVPATRRPIRRSSTSCRSVLPSPIPMRTTTCRWWRRRGATRRIAEVEDATCRRDIPRRSCNVHENSRILSRHIISELGRMPFSPARELGFALNDAARFLRTYADQRARDLNMTRAQWAVLVRLQRCEGVKQSELAEALDLGADHAGAPDRQAERGRPRRAPRRRYGPARESPLFDREGDAHLGKARRARRNDDGQSSGGPRRGPDRPADRGPRTNQSQYQDRIERRGLET